MKLSVLIETLIILIYLAAIKPVFAYEPLLKIVSPTDNQTILGSEITVSFILGNVIFGKEAHLHLWLDNTNQTATTATEITSHLAYILSNLSPGSHTLTLEAVKPNHSTFIPPVKQSSHFTIQAIPTMPYRQNEKTDENAAKKSLSREKIGLIAISLIIAALGIFLKHQKFKT